MNDYPPKPASYYIDLEKIIRACDQIINAAANIDNSVHDLNNAEETCSKEALYINGSTMDKPIEEVKNTISGSHSIIVASAEAIKSEITVQYNRLQKRYEDYLAEQERLARERENREKSKTSGEEQTNE